MYIIKRNNYYYNDTICRRENYTDTPKITHRFTIHKDKAKRFGNYAQANRVMRRVNGTTIEFCEDELIITKNLKQHEQNIEKLKFLIHTVGWFRTVSLLHVNEQTLRRYLYGRYDQLTEQSFERIEMTLSHAPNDSSICRWNNDLFVFDKKERCERLKQLLPRLLEIVDKGNYSLFTLSVDMNLNHTTVKDLLAMKHDAPSIMTLYRLEEFLKGYDVK